MTVQDTVYDYLVIHWLTSCIHCPPPSSPTGLSHSQLPNHPAPNLPAARPCVQRDRDGGRRHSAALSHPPARNSSAFHPMRSPRRALPCPGCPVGCSVRNPSFNRCLCGCQKARSAPHLWLPGTASLADLQDDTVGRPHCWPPGGGRPRPKWDKRSDLQPIF